MQMDNIYDTASVQCQSRGRRSIDRLEVDRLLWERCIGVIEGFNGGVVTTKGN